jgi:hypothetical protein
MEEKFAEACVAEHITGLRCSNGMEYKNTEFIIRPFSESSFLVRQKSMVKGKPPSKQFVIIPSRVVEAIYMEDCDHAKADAES